MNRTWARVSRGIGVAFVAASLVVMMTPAQAAPTAVASDAQPADEFVPPAKHTLSSADIAVTKGPGKHQLTVDSKSGDPLAIVQLTPTGDARAQIDRAGADFTLPSTWQRLGFGDICWRVPLGEPDRFVLPEPVLPFRGPPGTWRYSNVIVWTANGPTVFNKPQAGEFVTGKGAPIQYVIPCVSYVSTERAMRADPSAQPTTLPADSPSAATLPATLPADSASPEASATALPTASPLASDTPTPSTTNSIAVADAEKVTICHASTSFDNPYSHIDVAVSSIENSGHLEHTGPLYPQDGWGDIIPPVDGVTPGVNWPAGEGMLENGCQPVDPPIDPWPPIDPPEPPVRPEPPIIELPPIVPPIGTTSPTPSPTESLVRPSSSATPSQPIGSVSPTPSGTPSGTPSTPIGTTSPTPSGSTTSTPGPSESTTSSGSPSPSETTTTGTPEPTESGTSTPGPALPGDIVERIRDYCQTGDTSGLPQDLIDSRVRVLVTNGVSSTTVDRPYLALYCQANPQPGTVDEGDDLADTGSDLRFPLTLGLLLVGLGLLLLPSLRRSRR